MAKDVLFEVGLEELPARFVQDAEKQLLKNTEKWLHDLRIPYVAAKTYSTPRRLAIVITDIAEEQTTIEEEVKGPAVKIAKDNDGNWTKAAKGFSKGQGKTTDDLYTKDVAGVEYVFVNKRIEGKQTETLLPQFRDIILSIQFAKNMRWGSETIRFARPIRWLVALYGGEVIPFEIAHVHSGNRTHGHRFLGHDIVIKEPKNYCRQLEENCVLVEPEKRKQLIVEGIHALEQKEQVTIPIDDDLLHEVVNLVEYPTAFMGSFDESFLTVPQEALISSMKEHQRYFPVMGHDGQLKAHFVGVRNGNRDGLETVTRGNEKVLRARLADAQFFFEEDKKHPLDFYIEKLKKVVFQDKLGTIYDKTRRVMAIAGKIADLLGLDKVQRERIIRAAEISKFDLMTNMVNEFTELEGIMGEKYALHAGEDQVVAKAIAEHYMPRQANAALPSTIEGAIVSIADKLDTIVGCISVGLIPSGSQDPYGLRRKANGILRILGEHGWNITVEEVIQITQAIYEENSALVIDKGQADIKLADFFKLRVTYLLKETGIAQDVIQSVVKETIGVMNYTRDKAVILSAKRNDSTFKDTQDAFTRTLNLAKKATSTIVTPSLFETDSEQELYKCLVDVEKSYQKAKSMFHAEEALQELSGLTTAIHQFFAHNMVMAENEKVRANRLALIGRMAALISDYGDMTVIEWKQHF